MASKMERASITVVIIAFFTIGISITFVLLLQGEIFSSTIQQTGDQRIVFEEIGQFTDGGMAERLSGGRRSDLPCRWI